MTALNTYKLMDILHFSLENSFLTFMKNTQRSPSAISNRKKEIDIIYQNRISNVETKLNNIQDLFSATRNI